MVRRLSLSYQFLIWPLFVPEDGVEFFEVDDLGYPFIPSDDWFAARRLTQGSPINFNDTVLASESFPSQDHSLVPTPTVHTPALDQPATNIRQRRFECPSPTCPRAFDRLSRAQDCLNQHRNVTHSCNAACGEPNW